MWLSPPLLCTAAGDGAGCLKLGWGGGGAGGAGRREDGTQWGGGGPWLRSWDRLKTFLSPQGLPRSARGLGGGGRK